MIVLGVPVLSRYDLLERLIASAEAGSVKPDRYLIVDNGGKFTPSSTVFRAIARGASFSILSPDKNLGVAASWNAILREAHPEPVVISNDDIALGPETIARLYGDDGIGRHRFVIAEGPPQANGWCLFAQSTGCTATVGYYDENFFPAYYEDTDFHYRMTRAGVEAYRLPTDHTHEGWATIKREGHSGPTYLGQQKCLEYYVRKWGGAPGEERFQTPFDKDLEPSTETSREYAWVRLRPNTQQASIHSGPLMRYDVVNRILEKIGADRYLEIGVAGGETMRRVRSGFRVGVDPVPQPDAVAAATEFFPMTSDAFFARGAVVGKFGVTFIDGLHHADQAYRDIVNAAQVSDIVVVHDANPSTEAMQVVPYGVGDWTGDVWKAVARVRAEGKHTVRTVDADFGVAVIVPDHGKVVPELPRTTWADLVRHRTDLLGLLAPEEWEEWFDARDDEGAMNRFQRRAAKAMEGKSKRVCLCMIVRNESRTILRCLEAAIPFVDCWAIADTGSTDDTPAIVERFFAGRGCPGKLLRTTFKNFSQARNEALALARTVPDWDYALLIDADMVLSGTLDRAALVAPAYQLLQTDGAKDWWNARLVRRDVPAQYLGATHEYLSVEGIVKLENQNLHILDRADGSNRPEKAERDIRLLNESLAKDPQNGRTMFYLAETYKDNGRHHEAIQWYRRRIALGGWDEETYASYWGIAKSYQGLGDEAEMIRACLEAYSFRPSRGETLKLLAQHYRVKGKEHCESACLVAEALAEVGYPGDLLFVDRGSHLWGADQELSIAGYYSKLPRRREAAYRAWARLTTCPDGAVRSEAKNNVLHFARSALDLFGAETRAIDWKPADGYAPMNPSVCVGPADRRLVLVRTVNYTVTTEGQYPTLDGSGVIRTRNHVLEMDADWNVVKSTEIQNAPELPARKLGFVEGYEDCRLWLDRTHGAFFYASCTVRDDPENGDGRCEMAVLTFNSKWQVTSVNVVRDYESAQTQKNWMPIVGRPGSFVYLCDPTIVIDRGASSTVETHRSTPPTCLTDLRGGSQVIAHGAGWLALTHEVVWCPHRVYLHRFVAFDANYRVTAVTDPFYFERVGIEFCAGLAWDSDDRLVVSYGVNDASAHLAFFDRSRVEAAMHEL